MSHSQLSLSTRYTWFRMKRMLTPTHAVYILSEQRGRKHKKAFVQLDICRWLHIHLFYICICVIAFV